MLIKPNILTKASPEKAITTHPIVIDAICKILSENKCSIEIGDSSSYHGKKGTLEAFKISGIEDITRKYKAKIVAFDGYESIDNPKAKILKKIMCQN